jgi:hypothetical protein
VSVNIFIKQQKERKKERKKARKSHTLQYPMKKYQTNIKQNKMQHKSESRKCTNFIEAIMIFENSKQPGTKEIKKKQHTTITFHNERDQPLLSIKLCNDGGTSYT